MSTSKHKQSLSKKSKKSVAKSQGPVRSAPYDLLAMPDDIIARYPETMRKLSTVELAHDFERLSGWLLNGAPVISMRTNDKIRLICTYVDVDGKTALCFYKEQDDHKYEKTKKSIASRNRNKHVDNSQLLRGKTILPVVADTDKNTLFETTPTEQAAIKANKTDHRSVYFQKHFIYLDDQQQQVLLKTENWPLVISGPPGSGKSCVTAGLLASWLREAKQQGLWQAQASSSSTPIAASSTDFSVPAIPSSSDDVSVAQDKPMFAYITESTELHHLMHNNIAAQPGLEGLQTHIRFSNYHDLLRQVDPDIQHKKCLTKEESKQRFFEHDVLQLFLRALQPTLPTATKPARGRGKGKAPTETPVKLNANDLLKQKLYQECLNMAGCATQDEYLKQQGQRTSQFSDYPVAIRTALYKAFRTYQTNLDLANIVDPLLYRPKNPLTPRFLGMAIDEAQDYVPAQTWVLKQLAINEHIAYCVDTHQNIGAATANSIRDYLKNRLSADNISFNDSYRCPNNIIDIANVGLILKNHIKGGLADSDDYPEISRSDATRQQSKSGYVTLAYTKPYKLDKTGKPIICLPEGETLAKLKAAVQGNVAVAIVTRPELVDTLRSLLGHALVFSPAQIKGLEFNTIITWDLLRDPRYVAANKALPQNPLDKSNIKGRSKEKTINLEQNDSIIALCELFTALSRSTGTLHFNEPNDKHHLGKITGALETTINNFPINSQDDVNKPTPSTPEAWQAIMDQLIRQENNAAAQTIWNNDAIWANAAEKRTDSFATYRCKLLDLPSPLKKVKPTTTTTPLHAASTTNMKTTPAKSGIKTTASVSTINKKTPAGKTASKVTSANSGARKSTLATASQDLYTKANHETWGTMLKNTVRLIEFDITSPTAYRSRRKGIKGLFELAKSINTPAVARYYATSGESPNNATAAQPAASMLETLGTTQQTVINDIESWIRASTLEQLQTLFVNGDMLFLFASTPALLLLLTTLLNDIPALKEAIPQAALLRKKLIPNGSELKLSAFDLLITSELGFSVLSQIIGDNPNQLEEDMRRTLVQTLSSMENLPIPDQVKIQLATWTSTLSLAAPLQHFPDTEASHPVPTIFGTVKIESEIALHKAANFGDLDSIVSALTQGADINSKSKFGLTALHYACRVGHVDAVKLLLQKGAAPNVVDGQGITPMSLMMAKQKTVSIQRRLEIIAALFDAGANFPCDDGRHPFHWAAEQDDEYADNIAPTIQFFSDRNVPIDHSDTKSQAVPLHVAVLRGSQKIAQQLVNEWADLDSQDKTGLTPLHVAISKKHDSMVPWLLAHGANPNIPGNAERRFRTPLHTAVQQAQPDIIAQLLKAGAHINAQDQEGATPLHLAINQNNLVIINQLLQHGANPNIKDKQNGGRTPVHFAILQRQPETLKALLASGQVDLTVTDNNGCDALYTAQFLKDSVSAKILEDHRKSLPVGRRTNPSNTTQTCAQATPVPQSSSSSAPSTRAPVALDWGKVLNGQAKKKGWEDTILGIVQLNNVALSALNLVDFDITSPAGCENRREGIKQLFTLAKSMLAIRQSALGSATDASTSSTTVTLPGQQAWEALLQYNDKSIADIRTWLQESTPAELANLLYNGDMLLLLCSTPKMLSTFVPILMAIPELGKTITTDTLLRTKWTQPPAAEGTDSVELCLVDLLINDELGIELFCHLLETNEQLLPEHRGEILGNLFDSVLPLFSLQKKCGLQGDDSDALQKVRDLLKSSRDLLKRLLQLERKEWIAKVNQAENNDDSDGHESESDSENEYDATGLSEPLFTATYDGHPEHVRRLLLLGRSVNVRDRKQASCLHKAAGAESDEYTADIIDILVREWANLHAQDDMGATPLHWAAGRPETSAQVMQLLAHGASLHVKNKLGMKPWQSAFSSGNLDMFYRLIEYPGVDINEPWPIESTDMSALHQAVAIKDLSLLEKLLGISDIDVNAKNSLGFTPLHLAVQGRRLDIVALLLERKDVEIDKPDDKQGCSALHMALIMYGKVKEDNDTTRLKLVKMLVKHGANVNAQAHKACNYTPLTLAIQSQQAEAITYMLETGTVDFNLRDTSGKTPKEWAEIGKYPNSKRAFAEFERKSRAMTMLSSSSPGLFAMSPGRGVVSLTSPTPASSTGAAQSSGPGSSGMSQSSNAHVPASQPSAPRGRGAGRSR